MRGAGMGKQCRNALDLRVMRHRVAVRVASDPQGPTYGSGVRHQGLEPRTIALL
jgi:hypothetical protein